MGRHDDGAQTAETTIDRRRAAGLLVAGAGAAWVAPSVLSYDAAAAAGSSTGCPVCFVDDLVLNPGAESGVLAPWVASGTSSQPIAVWPWADLEAFGLTPPADVGTNAFAVFGDASGTARISQTIEFGPECGSAQVQLRAVVGAVAWEGDGQSTVAVTLTFRDAADVDLGAGTVAPLVATATPGQLTASATLETSTGSIPAGAVKVQVDVVWSGDPGTSSEPLVIGAVDTIDLRFNCLV